VLERVDSEARGVSLLAAERRDARRAGAEGRPTVIDSVALAILIVTGIYCVAIAAQAILLKRVSWAAVAIAVAFAAVQTYLAFLGGYLTVALALVAVIAVLASVYLVAWGKREDTNEHPLP
jgi:hypothetical protein